MLYWVEEESKLLLSTEPHSLGAFVIATNESCNEPEGFVAPLSDEEMHEITEASNGDIMSFLASDKGVEFVCDMAHPTVFYC